MFLYHFAKPDFVVETFFEKEGETGKRDVDFEKRFEVALTLLFEIAHSYFKGCFNVASTYYLFLYYSNGLSPYANICVNEFFCEISSCG